MARQAKEQAGSNAFLIIALIFFIITTIGLGFGTYSGYSIDDNKAEELKKAQTENKVLKADVEWNRFQALLYKQYLGYASKDEQTELDGLLVKFGLDKEKGTLDGLGGGSLAHKGGDVKKELREDAQPLVDLIKEQLEKRVKLNVKEGKLEDPSGYEGLLVKADERVGRTEAKADNLQAQLATEKAKSQGLQKVADIDNKEYYDTKLAERDKKQANAVVDFSKDKEKFEQDIKDLNKKLADEQTRAQEKQAALQTQVDELTKQLAAYRQALDQRTKEIAVLRQRGDDAPKALRSDWKIVKLAPGGTTAYINLGLADNVTPQLTFSIHGVGPDGKPEQTPKGSLEVINPQPGHVSEVRITSVKDRSKDPIVEGDVLFNPTWSPTQKKHVAIAGIVDLAGEGRNGLPEFIRYLERHNVVVDCYLDLNDLEFKRDGKPIDPREGITVQTEYLILGAGPEVLAQGQDAQYAKKLMEQQTLLTGGKGQPGIAREKGVQVIALPKYLDLIGYRQVGGSNLGSPSYRFLPPGPLPEQPKKDEKKEDKPLGG